MNREKVVCFLNHAAETGGAEFALARLVQSLDRSEWHPVVVFSEEGPAVDMLRADSVETYVIPLGAGLGKVRRERMESVECLSGGKCLAAVNYVFKLACFFRQRGVDLVHTNSMKAHVLGGVAARLLGIPLVWHLRDSLHPLCLPPMALRLMRFFAKNLPDALVTVSRSVANDALNGDDSKRAHVVYDGVSAECFSEVPAFGVARNGTSRVWCVGIVGRLCEWKGQHLFLEAAADLVEKGLNIRFEVLGGPLFGQEQYAERLRLFAGASGLDRHVCFHGFVSDVSSRIREWDLLVHASTAPDPCPNVVIEAMAAGVPVVGVDSGGVPELLEDGACGFLFPTSDARALSQCIESALKDELKRSEIARAARIRAERCFRSERVAAEVAAVWRPLINGQAYGRRSWPCIEEEPFGTTLGKQTAPGRQTSEVTQVSRNTVDSA
jgi:glycosyltransferase involved in cell wall biosynthesis